MKISSFCDSADLIILYLINLQHFQMIIKELETRIAELQKNQSCIPLIETVNIENCKRV